MLWDVTPCQWASGLAGLLDPEDEEHKSLDKVRLPLTQGHGVTTQELLNLQQY